MCCFNKQNQNYFCNCTPCCAPYFWQGGLMAEGYNQANANQTSGYNQANCCNQSNWFLNQNNATAFAQSNGFANGYYAQNTNGLVPITCCFGNIPQCCQTRYTFANCCRGARVGASNFVLDMPVSASFLHTPNYHNIVEIGF